VSNRYQLIVEDERGNVSEETIIGTLWETPLSADDKEKIVELFTQVIFKRERKNKSKTPGKRTMGEIAI
jgi:hypothetical protein